MHSHYSNGVLSPGQLVRKYAQEEYDVIALTDHDCISGIKEFLAASEAAGVKGVTGVELTSRYASEDRKCEIHILGYNFDPENTALKELCEGSVKRMENDEILSTEDAIDVIKDAGGQAFIAHPLKIKGLGDRGTEEYWGNLEAILKDLRKKGLKGLECINPDHNEDEEFRFVQLAGKYHLHISSGTDFHGDEEL